MVGLAKGFINGVPIIKIWNKGELNKKEIKKKLAEIEQKKKEEENKVNKIVNAKGKINDDDLDEEVEYFFYNQSGLTQPRRFIHHDEIGLTSIGASDEQMSEVDNFKLEFTRF